MQSSSHSHGVLVSTKSRCDVDGGSKSVSQFGGVLPSDDVTEISPPSSTLQVLLTAPPSPHPIMQSCSSTNPTPQEVAASPARSTGRMIRRGGGGSTSSQAGPRSSAGSKTSSRGGSRNSNSNTSKKRSPPPAASVTLIQIGSHKLTLPPHLAPEMVLDLQDLLLQQHQQQNDDDDNVDKQTLQRTLDLYTNRVRSSLGRGLPLDLEHRRILLQRSIRQAQECNSNRNSNSNNRGKANTGGASRSLSVASDARSDDAASLDASTVVAEDSDDDDDDDDASATRRAAVSALLSPFTGGTTTSNHVRIPHNLTPEMLHNCPLERLTELTASQQSHLLAAYTQKFRSVAEKNGAIWNTPKFQRALFGASVEQAAAAPAAEVSQECCLDSTASTAATTTETTAAAVPSEQATPSLPPPPPPPPKQQQQIDTNQTPPQSPQGQHQPEIAPNGRDATNTKQPAATEQASATTASSEPYNQDHQDATHPTTPAPSQSEDRLEPKHPPQTQSSGDASVISERQDKTQAQSELPQSNAAKEPPQSYPPSDQSFQSGQQLESFQAKPRSSSLQKDHEPVESQPQAPRSQQSPTEPREQQSQSPPRLDMERQVEVASKSQKPQSLPSQTEPQEQQSQFQTSEKHRQVESKVRQPHPESPRLKTQSKKDRTNAQTELAPGTVQPQSVPNFVLYGRDAGRFYALPEAEQEVIRRFCLDAAQGHEKIENPGRFYASQIRRYDAIHRKDTGSSVSSSSTTTAEPALPEFRLRGTSLASYEALSPEQQEEARQFCLDAAKEVRNINHTCDFFAAKLHRWIYNQPFEKPPAASSASVASTTSNENDVPDFVLRIDALQNFQSLSSEEQDEARRFCLEAAQGRTRIKHPPGFYSAQLKLFMEKMQQEKYAAPKPPATPPRSRIITSGDHSPSSIPAFELRGDALAAFRSLSVEDQEAARSYCREAAIGQPIKKRVAFYSFHFKQFLEEQKTKHKTEATEQTVPAASRNEEPGKSVPPFELHGEALASYKSLSPVSQDAARKFCLEAAKGQTIKSPIGFYCTQMKSFLGQQELKKNTKSTAAPTTTPTSPKQTETTATTSATKTPEKSPRPAQSDVSSMADESTTSNSAAPEFDIRGTDVQALFDSLPPDRQQAARQFCLDTARNRVLKNPRHFYATLVKQFLTWKTEKAGVELGLSGGLLTLFNKLVPRQQDAACRYCEDAAQKSLRVGRTIRNPTAYNMALFQSFLNDDTAGDGIPEVGFHAEAQKLYDKLPPLDQGVARKNLEDSARSVVESGRAIRNPFSFYSNILLKSLDDGKFVGAIPKFELKDYMIRQFYELSPEQQVAARRSCEDIALTEIQNGRDITNPPAFYTRCLQNFLKNELQSTEERSEQSKPTRSASSNSQQKSQSQIEQLRKDHFETQVLLETSKKEIQHLTQSNEQLTKLWDSEKNTAKTLAERLKQAEDDVFGLRHDLKAKTEALETISSEKLELEQRYAEDQEMVREVTGSFSKISREMVLANEGKRLVEAELKKEQERGREKDLQIQKLRADIKRMDMLRPSNKKSDPGSDKAFDRLKQELKETREKLEKEKKKNAAFVAAKKQEPNDDTNAKRQRAPDKPSISDHLPDVILNTKPAVPRILTRLSAPPPAPLPPSEPPIHSFSASDSGISFDGIDTSYDAPNSEWEERITQEVDFLQSSYSRDELKIEGKKVTRTLHLPIDRDKEEIVVHLMLSIRDGYPVTAPLCVEALIWPEGSSKRVDAHKVAGDAVLSLVNVCQCKANISLGSEAVFSTLQAADQWVNLEWASIQEKRLSKRDRKNSQDIELCRLLISTHHIHDNERIHSVIKAAGKYDLGGYIKTGKPGFVLVEGLDDNCQFFFESLLQDHKKMRESKPSKTESSNFSVSGKSIVSVEDLDQERALPRKLMKIEHSKEGMAEFKKECRKVDLSEFLSS